MNEQIPKIIYDERVLNFIAGAFLFIILNIFDEMQKQRYYCPLYCEAKHKHVLVSKKHDR